MHRINGFICRFHGFLAVLRLNTGPIKATIFPLFFHCLTPLLQHCFPSDPRRCHSFFFSLLCHSFFRPHFPRHSSFPSVFLTVFPPILLYSSFFHGILSVRLLHSGHTSKLSFILHACFTDNGPTQEFFHCFSIVSRMLYAIMVPHRSLNFTWHHFTLSLFFPPFSLRFPIFFSILLCQSPSFFSLFFSSYVIFPYFFYCFSYQSAQIHLGGFTHALRDNDPISEPQFYLASFYPLPILSTVFIAFPFFFHSFMSCPSPLCIVFLILCHISLFFYCFSYQFVQIHLGGRTRGESIPQRHPIATLKKVYLVHLFYHLFSSFLSVSGRSAPRPP